MRKWKHVFHLIQEKKGKIKLRDESGMTLIELLASILLLSVVISLAGAVHMFGQKQYLTQSSSAIQSNDFAYTLSVISKEIRSKPFATIEVTESKDVLLIDDSVVFSQQDSQLLKNSNQILAEDVADFIVTLEPDTKSATVLLKSLSKNNSQSKEYQTTIYFRE
ncbi:MAG: prepilin-type N-terminal cleavage/methylation domain-containing protein [Carnobacterium sp.]|nr:prepilin-type N-terminal cleavage/methylation domain-containing protein [Carnobacterium sp.]